MGFAFLLTSWWNYSGGNVYNNWYLYISSSIVLNMAFVYLYCRQKIVEKLVLNTLNMVTF